MQIREVMSNHPEYINSSVSIREAARRMCDLNCGFLPVAENDKIVGIITDRDIVKRAMADGMSADDPVSAINTSKVLYCKEDDDVDEILDNMEENQVQRLIVLNNMQDKDFVGVVSLGDIADHSADSKTNERIAACCRHYH